MPQTPSSSSKLPKNWPKDITYLTTLHIPPPLSNILLQTSTASPPSNDLPIIKSPPTPNPLIRILPITIPSHPAYGQHGLVATRALAPLSFIILYLGTLHHSSDTLHAHSDYDLNLDHELGLSIDAATRGNEARFINDYRGVRPEGPNAEFRDCLVEVSHGRYERRIGVFVPSAGKAGKRSKGIAKGEEIVVSYGKGFWNARKEEDRGENGE
ncbi:uncharacterized protein Z518_08170 [Rhinocladiella mackenziei CBS 650.93]|uniref:SET domain-containing protein n=1 Tax=Rhinocladiella mackenziei CBS 650.93 TaxID=1442369 RepID=A0A0D2IG31_9EURO|nr:uncharacterized protein Z518_08170 [Rhinocladiella mackenziei CBS 650.93]KIX02231.1 hypothetical protein Z518_08170 [Rhinocladiella mackenziei CBS 650.93]